MRIFRLLILFSFSFSVTIALAEDKSNEKLAATNSKPGISSRQHYDFWSSDGGRKFTLVNPESYVTKDNQDDTCYTMRTYITDPNFDKRFIMKSGPDEVSYGPPARRNSQPDSQLNGSYTICQPSSRFEVKTTVQPVETEGDAK
jgi:hypothetical protein